MTTEQDENRRSPSAASRDIYVGALDERDSHAILTLEESCWPSPLRATAQLLQLRFGLGHGVFGAKVGGRLVGQISYSFSEHVPGCPLSVPRTFEEFSQRPTSAPFNTVFAYNLNVDPAMRGGPVIHRLISHALSTFRSAGCGYILGVARCPSYRGSHNRYERIDPNPVLGAIIDHCLLTGRQPSTEELTLDPLLRFYHRSLHCRFLGLLPDFLPADSASGGIGASFVTHLQ
jgi:hypothetical protein